MKEKGTQIKTTKRIRTVCSALGKCVKFADVGCDHGYCTAYMLENGLCESAQISDVSDKCLAKAEKLLCEFITEGRVKSVCCDGLTGIERDTDLVLIAGMGGEEIIKILEEGFLPDKLLLQPMKNTEKVRKFLIEKGYELFRDYTFFADGKFYDLIKAERTGRSENYTELMLRYGKDNLFSPSADFLKKLERDIRNCEQWLASANADSKKRLESLMSELKEIYDETQGNLRGDR